MDDQTFDDSIKSKVGDYEESTFDPSALSALHQQMGAVSNRSQFIKYKTELIVGAGLALATIIIIGSQWLIGNQNQAVASADKIELKIQREQIDRLEKEVRYLRTLTTDTIKVIEIRKEPSGQISSLRYQIAGLEAALAKLNEHGDPYLGEEFSGVPLDSSTLQNGALPNDPGAIEYPSTRITPHEQARKSAHAMPKMQHDLEDQHEKTLSAKTLRNLEKHYQKGIGIRVGPTLELAHGFYPYGKGPFEITSGVLGDFILSPYLSVETGLKYVHRFYEISNEDELSGIQLPGINENLGALKQADIDSWIFEIPVTLKYRYPLSMKTHWLAGLGYSPMLYTKQVFEYYYAIESNPQASVNFRYTVKGAQLFSGTLNFSLGLSNELKNKKHLETSLFYRHSLGGLGAEKTTADFIGVRGVYWFTVR